MTVPFLEIAEVYTNGTKLIKRNTFVDDRGEFDRLFTTHNHLSDLKSFHVKDVNISSSHRSVLRGMHFQNAPFSQQKIVTVLQGEILDVTFKIPDPNADKFPEDVHSTILSGKDRKSLFIPANVAHGFLVMSEFAVVAYLMDEVFNSDAYDGIHWRSFGFDWPISSPNVSKKDASLIDFLAYERPEFSG